MGTSSALSGNSALEESGKHVPKVITVEEKALKSLFLVDLASSTQG
jgi:hypothetical protein